MQEFDEARARFRNSDSGGALKALGAAYNTAQVTRDGQSAEGAADLADQMAAAYSGLKKRKAEEYAKRFRQLMADYRPQSSAATATPDETTAVTSIGEPGVMPSQTNAATTGVTASAEATQPSALGRSAVAQSVTRPSVPYEWVLIVVGVCFLVGALAVVGGAIEASNHTHTTIDHGVFGVPQKNSSWDYNYLWAGIGAGFFWFLLGTVILLLRSVAVDVRRLADHTVSKAT